MSATNIIQQIQDTLIKQYAGDVDIVSGELDELFGPGFVNQYPDSDRDGDMDVTNASGVDVPYTTSRPIPVPKGKKAGSNYVPFGVGEAKGIDTEKEATGVADKAVAAADQAGADAGAEAGADVGADVGAEAGADAGMDAEMNMGDMGGEGGMDNMGMMGEQEEEKSPTELGRIYELKKIYSRLTAIESYLGNESDQELLEIRNSVSQGIELFEIVSSNFDSYKDNMNEIIVMYYKFILEVYESVKKFYRSQKHSGD